MHVYVRTRARARDVIMGDTINHRAARPHPASCVFVRSGTLISIRVRINFYFFPKPTSGHLLYRKSTPLLL